MTTNTNYISSSKARVFKKHAASVKSLKLTLHIKNIQHESVVAFVKYQHIKIGAIITL